MKNYFTDEQQILLESIRFVLIEKCFNILKIRIVENPTQSKWYDTCVGKEFFVRRGTSQDMVLFNPCLHDDMRKGFFVILNKNGIPSNMIFKKDAIIVKEQHLS